MKHSLTPGQLHCLSLYVMRKFHASRQQLCSNAGNGIVQKMEFVVENQTVRKVRLTWGIWPQGESGAFIPKKDGTWAGGRNSGRL